MSSLHLVLCSIFLLSFASLGQIVVPINSTLLQASQDNSSSDARMSKAYVSILQTHPELQNYSIISITSTTVNSTGTDYYVMLKGSDNSTIMVVVSLESNLTAYFVSYFKIDAGSHQATNTAPLPAPQPANAAITDNLQSAQAILTNNNPNIPTKTNNAFLLGGYRPLNNLNDIKFQIGLSYLRQMHTNLINYELISAEYQVITGVNFIIQYIGLDKITKISAKIFVGLNGVPQEVSFNVSCFEPFVLDCTDELAAQIYYGNQFVIDSHPELKHYRLISIYVEEKINSDLTFMSTFENKQLALRAISEVTVNSKSVNLLSYYSYRYL